MRRVIHAGSLPLADLAGEAGAFLLVLDEFLTGECMLRSGVLDRLAKCLVLVRTPEK